MSAANVTVAGVTVTAAYITITSQGCFSAEDTVTLEGGAVIKYSDIKIGDRVLSAKADGTLFFDKVFRITHFSHTESGYFHRIVTSRGKVLELTGNHFIQAGASGDLIDAGRLKVGDTVYVVDNGALKARADTITAITSVIRDGVYNVHTLSSSIVVNGVLASHYTTETAWSPATRSLAPVWYRAVDMASLFLGAEDVSTVHGHRLRRA